ncbi:chromogranin-A-like [Pungitius pungitius]|uniref:chromogranin-A-like n=1 Tax=Pungitius pungitius TaxID=134920 RepID=UPI002E0FEB81
MRFGIFPCDKLKLEHQEHREEEEQKEQKEEEEMKPGAKDKVISGHTPISASSSSAFTFFPFLSSSPCPGEGGEDDEVRVAIVTIEDESCPSEPFGADSNLETTNRIPERYGEGHKKDRGGAEGDQGEKEGKEEEKDEEEEEETSELTSPSLSQILQRL